VSVLVDRDRKFVEEICAIADDVAAPAADDVDRNARFPLETVTALRELRALSAFVPVELGGDGLSFEAIARACFELGRRCASSGMVFAMHQMQVACLVRHLEGSSWFEAYLRDLSSEQRLIASVTSEVGTGGDMGRSVASLVEEEDGTCSFEKQSTTLSYGNEADDLLVTLRRSPEAESGDQVLVLARRGQITLEQSTGWDPLGMRGTCSPGFRVRAEVLPEQALSAPFSQIAAESMVPISHVLWSHVWLGIASDAFDRARAFVRSAARKTPIQDLPFGPRLSQLLSQLALLRAEVDSGLRTFVEASDDAGRGYLTQATAALRFNNLKIAASEQAPLICQGALSLCGIAGYLNDSPYSIGRQLRDSLSASLMVANDRIRATNAGLILIAKDI
jgi:acyl-CoA dehydrogenase